MRSRRPGPHVSAGDRVLAEVDAEPGDRGGDAGRRAGRPRAATPPWCCSTPGCCSAAADLRADEEALRRWINAAALVRARRGGRVRRGRRPRPPCAPGAGPVGPRRLRRAARSTSAARRTCRRRRRLATITGEPGAVDDALSRCSSAACRTAPRCSVRCPSVGDGDGARRVRRPGPARPRRRRCPRALVRAAGASLGPQADRTCGSQVDPVEPRLSDRRPGLRRLVGRQAPRHPAEGAHVSIRPIRLFGDPVLRTPRRSRSSTSTRSCARSSRPDRHDARRARGRPGRAADRGRPAGVHLARRRRGRPPGQPAAPTCPRRPRTAPRAACRSPA